MTCMHFNKNVVDFERYVSPIQFSTMVGKGWCKLLALIVCILCQTMGKHNIAEKNDYLQKINTLIDIQIRQKVMDYSLHHIFIHEKVNIEWTHLILNSYAKKISVVLFRTEHRLRSFSPNRIKTRQVVAVYNDLSDVNIVKWKDGIKNKWNPSAKLTVWITGNLSYDNLYYRRLRYIRNDTSFRTMFSTSIESESIHTFFENFWIHKSYNVILIAFNKTSNNFDLMRYNPFIMNKSRRGKVYIIDKNEKWFPDKFTDVHGYPITISVFEKPPYIYLKNNNTEMMDGEDVHFIRILIAQMNFTLKILSDKTSAVNYAVKLPDGKVVGLIGDLLLNRSEMLGNSRFIHSAFDRRIRFLYPYSNGEYIAVVPVRLTNSSFRMIDLNRFCLRTLIALTPVILLSLYLYFRKERYPILTAWNLVLQQQFLRIGTQNYDRIIRMTYIIFAIIVVCTFEGRLIKLLTAPRYNTIIDNLEDLAKSNLSLMVGDKMYNIINQSTIHNMQRLAKKTTTNLNFTQCLENLLEYGNVACATDKLSALIIINNVQSQNERYHAHIMKEPLGNFFMIYAYKKDLPFANKFDLILRRLLESGIKVKETQISSNKIRSMIERKRCMNSTNFTGLSISHFETTFYVYFFGLTISLIIFFIEMYSGKCF